MEPPGIWWQPKLVRLASGGMHPAGMFSSSCLQFFLLQKNPIRTTQNFNLPFRVTQFFQEDNRVFTKLRNLIRLIESI